MTEKLISVIMPAFNAERFIGKALESVGAQTHRNWEIIVTNDGGTDGTSRIVAEFARSASQNVQLFEHAQSQGPSAARNTAMKAAKGDYIAFLDADDFWTPDHLESMCAVLKSGKADLVYASAMVFQETASGEMELFPPDAFEVTDPPADLFQRNFINPSGGTITRQLMEKVGDFDRNLRGVEDVDYWIRAAALGFPIVPTGEKTYYYRKSPGSLSAATAKMAEGTASVYEKNRNCGILPERKIVSLAKACYFAAGKLYWREDAASASRMFYKSWALSKAHLLPLACASFAAGMSLVRPQRSK
jgi:glycosyltransferase involved in cell wall biosynthesis